MDPIGSPQYRDQKLLDVCLQLIDKGIQLRIDLIEVIDKQLDEGLRLQKNEFRTQACVLAVYAGGATMVAVVLTFFLSVVLDMPGLKQIVFLVALGGFISYFALRALFWNKHHRIKMCEHLGDKADAVTEELELENRRLAASLHVFLSKDPTMLSCDSLRHQIEQSIFYGVNLPGKTSRVFENWGIRHIYLSELKMVYDVIESQTEWLIRSQRILDHLSQQEAIELDVNRTINSR